MGSTPNSRHTDETSTQRARKRIKTDSTPTAGALAGAGAIDLDALLPGEFISIQTVCQFVSQTPGSVVLRVMADAGTMRMTVPSSLVFLCAKSASQVRTSVRKRMVISRDGMIALLTREIRSQVCTITFRKKPTPKLVADALHGAPRDQRMRAIATSLRGVTRSLVGTFINHNTTTGVLFFRDLEVASGSTTRSVNVLTVESIKFGSVLYIVK
jgi:hypothetical protein